MQSALELAEEQARLRGASRIHRITLRRGKLAGVGPEALAFAFDVVTAETIADGATLGVESVPVVCFCAACRAKFAPEDFGFVCPRCGAPDRDVRAGRELELVLLLAELVQVALVQRRGLRHLAQVGPQPGLVFRDRLQLPPPLADLALRPGPLPAQSLRLPEARLDLVADHRALQEGADLLVGAVGQQGRRGDVTFLGHGLLGGLAGGHLQLEAVHVARRLGRLVLA
jgi:hydrogenase nickel incorporation protein HypA/HybF